MCVEGKESVGVDMIRTYLTYTLAIIAVYLFVWTTLLLTWMNIDAELVDDVTRVFN